MAGIEKSPKNDFPVEIDKRSNCTISEKVTYSKNCQLETLLSLQTNLSGRHDEFLFHTFHQVMEIWFRQIIIEIDSIRDLMLEKQIHQLPIMVIIERLDRILKIFQVLSDQMKILETMNPLEFVNFRQGLGDSSGFESYQFRIIENKFGVLKVNRVLHNGKCYTYVFDDEEILKKVRESEEEKSLLDCVNIWLERIADSSEMELKEFVKRFTQAFEEKEKDKKQETLKPIFDEECYNMAKDKGERRLSWKAFIVALMIQYEGKFGPYKNEWQLLNLLMDIDAAFMKWRFSHLTIVYRQIGVKQGTAKSSGYYYLRSSISERYHVFRDLFRLSSILIPEDILQKYA